MCSYEHVARNCSEHTIEVLSIHLLAEDLNQIASSWAQPSVIIPSQNATRVQAPRTSQGSEVCVELLSVTRSLTLGLKSSVTIL